jgi:V/A-type H+-transporting ATPase subunit D
MSTLTPTRSIAIQLRDERRTMREGYAFLDEKCLLLAGSMLREVRAQQERLRHLQPLLHATQQALAAALMRHGLNGLQVYPAPGDAFELAGQSSSLLGVPMRSAIARAPTDAPPAVAASPEAAACGDAYGRLVEALAPYAAASGNLARLLAEYRKTVRRVRALQDVLIPEVENALAEVETGLDELERDEFTFLRRAAEAARAA